MDNLTVNKTIPNTVKSYKAETDCLINTNTDQFLYTVSGTGASFTNTAVTSTENCFGLLRTNLGTTATGRVSIASPNLNIFRFSSGDSNFQSYFKMVTLSSAAQTYVLRAGFIDNITAESANGIFFRYTNGVNSGKWQTVVRINNVETVTDTGITATLNQWVFAEIVVKPSGTIYWTLNTYKTSTSATIGNMVSGYGLFALKTVGTVATSPIDCDYISVTHNFTVDRK